MVVFFVFILLFFLKIFFLSKALQILITLEFVSISLFYLFYNYQIDNTISFIMMIVLIVLLVVESVLGLCIFLQCMRYRGNDSMRSLKKK